MAQAAAIDYLRIRQVPIDLRVGDAHAGVSEVKTYLQRYEYFAPNAINDTFDLQTQRAIRNFQDWFDLNQTGCMDGPTKAAMTQRRCALSGGNPLAANTIGAWNEKALTYAFGPTSLDLNPEKCRQAVQRAFQTWEHSGVGLTFKEVAVDVAHHIYIDWRNAGDNDLDMRGPTLAHADFPPGYSIIARGGPLPLHFDDSENIWVDGAVAGAFDIETVALHEIGHCLGLLHSNVPGAVMFPTVSDGFLLRSLQRDDRRGIRRLYP
ncbi:hypothetical protein H2198_002583 [Neophaeococcomyces mojaviensis]|uniref:Uncharacterized protein n=1 Tax=Neophaeococcomyces mojaviensis TaxID=3383035 RepID=A0ACC3ADY6_9EURO|nr:hypothetical protein H2198_002583 [Knufia sp. JES_112]